MRFLQITYKYSACTANETKLTAILKINTQDQLIRDMEDVALHVLKKDGHSNSPEIQFKTGGREVINLIPIT